jgi:hypothetical protein
MGVGVEEGFGKIIDSSNVEMTQASIKGTFYALQA